MNKLYCLIIMFIACGVCSGQNLVPNGDFELGPDSSSVGWTNKIGTPCSSFPSMPGPDFWTVSSPTPDRLIEGQNPFCFWDEDTAQSGKAFIVIGNVEAGKTTLISPLEKDSTYLLSYYMQWETMKGLFMTLPCRISFNFNNGGDSLMSPFNGDSANWQYYDTIFIAKANSTEMEIKGLVLQAGAEIDNVSLIKINSTGISEYLQKSIIICPNPFFDNLTITTKTNELLEVTLYDITSRKIFNQSFTNSTSINTEQLAKGIYLYEVRNKSGVIKKGKVVKD